MEIQDSSSAIYSEAKSEYTKQLVFNFQPTLLRFFLDRHSEAKTAPSVVSKVKSALSEFQESLTQIPEWNLDKVQRETSTLLQSVHCDYIEDLITAVFIAHTKILSAIRLNAKPRQKIRITVPKPDHFMHRTLSECSRLLWSSVYLFNDSVSSLERQKNMNDVNRLIEEGLLQAIRNLLPVKSILRDSLQEEEDDIQIQNEDNASSESTVTKNELETFVSETGSQGISSQETPVTETPVTETPVAETPMAETPMAETPMAETPVIVQVPLTDTGSQGRMTKGDELDSSFDSDSHVDTLVPMGNNTDVKGLQLTADAFPKQSVHIEKQNTLVVDTEKTVGFTGVDSVFGTTGDAELRPMIDEGSDEFKILGDLESLDTNEFEDIDSEAQPIPLGSDDYESI